MPDLGLNDPGPVDEIVEFPVGAPVLAIEMTVAVHAVVEPSATDCGKHLTPANVSLGLVRSTVNRIDRVTVPFVAIMVTE